MKALRQHLVITMVSALHLGWGVSMWFSKIKPVGGVPTPLWHLTEMFGRGWTLDITLLLTGICAMCALLNVPRMPAFWRSAGLIPQQALLTISGVDSFIVAARGAYADGAVYHHGFIFRDQWPMMLATLFHAVAVIGFHRAESAKERA